MRKLILLLALFIAAPVLHATTYYIRPDGGTATQCTGTTNAAYPGSGTAQACALSHPYWMINFSTNGWLHLVGGDTIQFVNTSGTSDTYLMGENNAGVGTDWNALGYSACPTPNQGSQAGTGCVWPVFPSGTSGAHTKIIGQNAGSCHDSGHTHLVNPTILDGINNAFYVLNVAGTNYVDISCIEVTQNDSCSGATGTDVTSCTDSVNSTKNFVGGGGGGGIIFNYLPKTAWQNGPTNITITDVAVAGISTSGILGSDLNNLSSSGVSTFTDMYIIGNALAGWNGDAGGCGTTCESQGTFNLNNSTIDWNGCTPATMPYNAQQSDTLNAFTNCTDADNSGGYGDGFVQIAAANVSLVANNDHFRWNTQDGFDALHLSDDLTKAPSISLNNSWSEGNSGQTFKVGAGATLTAIGNVSISNCYVLQTASNFPLNPTNWNAGRSGSSQYCRANGDQWAFQLSNSTAVTLQNNTSVGYGNVMYDIECAAGTSTCVTGGGSSFNFTNNISKGYPDFNNGNKLATGFYMGAGTWPGSTFTAKNDLWNTMYSGTGCPDAAISPTPTGSQCGDPLLVGESNINAINPNITNGSSPALGNGLFVSGYTADYNGNAVTNPPQIGAFGQTGGTSTVANPTASPVAGTYVGTQSVALATTTSGATICYTTNGTTPAATTPGTCSTGTTYSTPIAVSTSETVMAIGTLSGDTNSSVVSFAYTINPVATPTASPVAGTYTGTQSVMLSSTSGATICYTTNGTTPAATTPGTCSAGTTYSGAISVATSETIQALGTKSGATNSSVGSFAYVISTTPAQNMTVGGTIRFNNTPVQ